MSTAQLIELFHHRWSPPALALIAERRGARFVELQRGLGVGRDSLRRALDALVDQGLVRANEGYGHPLRPEYVPTRRSEAAADVARRVAAIREHVKLPIGVGFGIRDAATAKAVASVADAVVIGSRIIQEIESGPASEAASRAGAWLATIRAALDETAVGIA